MGLRERSRQRRKRIVGNVANSHEEAEQWDLEFWQSLSPQQRLQAVESLKRDLEKIRPGRRQERDT